MTILLNFLILCIFGYIPIKTLIVIQRLKRHQIKIDIATFYFLKAIFVSSSVIEFLYFLSLFKNNVWIDPESMNNIMSIVYGIMFILYVSMVDKHNIVKSAPDTTKQ